MREIKFRAWDKKYKNMSSFDEMMNCRHFAIMDSLDSKQFIVLPLHENAILMQFTGLKDKNGREIYEGDILGGERTTDGQVKFEAACFILEYDDSTALWKQELRISLRHREVKGNIYENPELLQP